MLVDDVLIYDVGGAGQSETGDLILPALDDKHDLTKSLLAHKIPLRFGPSRSVRVDPGRASQLNTSRPSSSGWPYPTSVSSDTAAVPSVGTRTTSLQSMSRHTVSYAGLYTTDAQ